MNVVVYNANYGDRDNKNYILLKINEAQNRLLSELERVGMIEYEIAGNDFKDISEN